MTPIAIIYMGGTFGCVSEPLSPMPAEAFLDQLSQLPYAHAAELNFFAAPCIKDSSEVSAKDWLALSQLIDTLAADFQHFVLIHGTDTLSYAGAFLQHIFNRDVHLFITGSQYPLLNRAGDALHPNSDAWQNLNFAIQQVLQQEAGVYIGFNQQCFAAASCYKYHTSQFQAFIGQPAETKSTTSLAMRAQLAAAAWEGAAEIELVNLYISPGSSQCLALRLQQLAQQAPQILILQAFGSGNLPYSQALAAQLTALTEQGCWVILSSQVLYGQLSQHYATGSWLSATGVVFDPHYSQADTYARAILLYMQYGKTENWQAYWQL